MTEIRICHKGGDCTDQGHETFEAGPWHPDSPANREMLRIILESCNEIHGPGSHWIEVREPELADH